MQNRLKNLLAEIEDINNYFQNGCIDRSNLEAFKDRYKEDPDELMCQCDDYLQKAFDAIDHLTEMMEEEE